MPHYRSRTSTHGRNMAGARALWRATGMKDDDFGKPIIAVVNSFTQFVPGHVHLRDLGALVDLEPISLSWLNDKLRLSEQEIAAYSPIHHVGNGVPAVVAVGGAELPELVRQSDEYAAACEAAGQKVALVHVPGCTHFSVLDDLARADGVLMTALAQLD